MGSTIRYRGMHKQKQDEHIEKKEIIQLNASKGMLMEEVDTLSSEVCRARRQRLNLTSCLQLRKHAVAVDELSADRRQAEEQV